MNDQRVKLEKNPKLLGVTFDTQLTFTKHIEQTVNKAKSRLNILKSLAGSDWGQDKSTILLTYKSIIRSILEYAVPVWGPTISATNWENLYRVEKQALRIATGCLLMTNEHHLHQETKVLPLRQHSLLLTKQFLVQCFDSTHPGNKHLHKPVADRPNRKPTLYKHKPEIEGLFNDLNCSNDKAGRKKVIKNLHTKAVADCISSYQPNRVLQRPPPEISKTEENLTRRERTYLAQLRSGFCRKLMYYRNRIDNTVPNNCPTCGQHNHDTAHLFACPGNPTNLSPTHLWTEPEKASLFLKLVEEIT